jgi:hypothetical protein
MSSAKLFRFSLRSDSDLSAQYGAERDHRRDRDEIERALHPIGSVLDPRRDAFGQERRIEHGDG